MANGLNGDPVYKKPYWKPPSLFRMVPSLTLQPPPLPPNGGPKMHREARTRNLATSAVTWRI